jgi:hypothetical protein
MREICMLTPAANLNDKTVQLTLVEPTSKKEVTDIFPVDASPFPEQHRPYVARGVELGASAMANDLARIKRADAVKVVRIARRMAEETGGDQAAGGIA